MSLKINASVAIDGSTGVVRFIGLTQFGEGKWVGIELDSPRGDCDGSVNGVRYFACAKLTGTFVRPNQVRVIRNKIPLTSCEQRETSKTFTVSVKPISSPERPKSMGQDSVPLNENLRQEAKKNLQMCSPLSDGEYVQFCGTKDSDAETPEHSLLRPIEDTECTLVIPLHLIRRSTQRGAVTLRLLEMDISLMPVDAIINAANKSSFTPMDCGVSGALRNACKPAVVTGQPKKWWSDNGDEHESVSIPSTQAGVQTAAGGLLARGVKHVVHAFGPIWTDFPANEDCFPIVMARIRLTVKRALSAAARMGSRSCALPAISGGIFTHWSSTTDIKAREQKAARLAVVEAVFAWVEKHPNTCLIFINFCDLSSKKLGFIHFFLDAFDEVTNRSPEEKSEN